VPNAEAWARDCAGDIERRRVDPQSACLGTEQMPPPLELNTSWYSSFKSVAENSNQIFQSLNAAGSGDVEEREKTRNQSEVP